MAAHKAQILSKALESADIDIVGGDGAFLDRMVNSISMGKGIDALDDQCDVISGLAKDHFAWATRSCDSYDSRPGMCRDYPRPFLEQANPEFLEGCRYKALARGRESLIQILEKESLTPEQLAKLKKGLYLED